MNSAPITFHMSNGKSYTYTITAERLTWLVNSIGKGKGGAFVTSDQVINIAQIASLEYPKGIKVSFS